MHYLSKKLTLINALRKSLGFWAATSLIIGSIIGSGVFMKPAAMAAELGSPVWLSAVWVIAGLFSFIGALVFAELGAMMPETGGIYYYFRKMFGDFFGFLYGWAAFSVINTAAVAAIAFVCAEYADRFIHFPRFDAITEKSIEWHIPFIGDIYPLENFGVKSLAVLFVILLTYLNSRSVKSGSQFQVVSTFIKMAVIAALVFGIFFSGNGDLGNFVNSSSAKMGNDLFSGIVVAMTGAFFAYDGWINITFIAGEVKDPQRNIPRSLIIGMFACILVYLLVNQAYLYVLPVETIANSSLVAADAISIAWGNEGSMIVSALIVICTFGAINGNIMATARVTYAMGKDRVFLPWSGREHRRFNTPANALWLHGIWTSVFILTGSFNMLADMFVFVTWISYLVGAIGILILRKKHPEMTRPYKIPGYPWVPILFILFSAFYLITTIRNDITNYLNDDQPIINSLLGIAITGLGVPLFYFFKWRERKNGSPNS